MRILKSLCTALVAIIPAMAAAQTVPSQVNVLIMGCTLNGDTGPALSNLQVSSTLNASCEMPTMDISGLCAAVDDLLVRLDTGVDCTEAAAQLEAVGVQEQLVAAVPPRQSARNYVFQNNQTDLAFLMDRAHGEVDLTGCDVLRDGGPSAPYVQMSNDAGSNQQDMTCADALQASLDSGGLLSSENSFATAAAGPATAFFQQGRLIVDSDFNEAKPAEFVIIRIGQHTVDSN